MRVFVIIAIIATCVIGCGQNRSWSGRIISKKIRPPSALANVHVSDINVIIIDGTRFERVRGFKPFYLQVPGSNSILFVTDESDYSVKYHCFDMDMDRDTVIDAQSSVFGRSIGLNTAEDVITNVNNGKILLCNLDTNARSVDQRLHDLTSTRTFYLLDLPGRTVSGRTMYLNKDGAIIEERTE